MRGVYASIRLCSVSSPSNLPSIELTPSQPKPSLGGSATGLAVNVDVANGAFWAPQDLHQAARNLCKARNRGLSYAVFQTLLRPVRTKDGIITQSDEFKELRKMTNLKFVVKHRGKAESMSHFLSSFDALLTLRRRQGVYYPEVYLGKA
jgi:eukaryotic translation initiation factor 2C